MTALSIYPASGAAAPITTLSNTGRIGRVLAAQGVGYEHRRARAALPARASSDDVLAAYRDDVAQISAGKAYGAIDVYRITPDAPNKATARLSFLSEHTHSEDEVRFLVEGQAAFYLHLGDQVYQLVCTSGDLLNVPAGARHWFDMGSQPRFTAIRFLGAPQGWVAHFTGSAVPAGVPLFDATPAL
jgi:1,2-dihydroxy-3-keto-5-methylthiopentene dioxygenase